MKRDITDVLDVGDGGAAKLHHYDRHYIAFPAAGAL
jgi:hypothetical protein